MATVTAWNPFGVSLNITATAGTVTRTSATQFTVRINASWASYWGAKTNYGMTASSGGGSATINPFGTKAASGSGSFTGTYSISGNGSATKTITVTFKNFNSDNGNSATKNVSFNVTVPAWTSYTVSYNANGGSGAPSSQTKWKNQTLTLSSTKPTRTGYSFLKWNTASGGTGTSYNPGGSYTANSGATLYAQWKANTYTVSYDANGGTGAPSDQTKTYGVTLQITSVTPTRDNYNFLGWSTSASSTTIAYQPGSNYTSNAAITLYAVWELAYISPSISEVKIERCSPAYDDEDNVTYVSDDEGVYARISFNWSTFEGYPVEDVNVAAYIGTECVTRAYIDYWNNETSGSVVDFVFGNSLLDPEVTYDIQIMVFDLKTQAVFHVTLPSAKHPIDILRKGLGIAFNKSAELEGVADMNFQFKPTAGYLYPVLEAGADLDDEGYRIPNKWVLQSVQTSSYTCGDKPIPISSGTGILTIETCGPEGQTKHTIEVCHKTNPLRFERYYYKESSGTEMTWGDWYEAGGYKSAITVGLTENKTLGIVAAYTQIPFDKLITSKGGSLTLTDGYVKIGTGIQRVMLSCQIRVVCGTAYDWVNRHVRLCINRNGTIQYVSWMTVSLDSTSGTNNVIQISPILTNVQEGDLIHAVFYTADKDDGIYSGADTNGYQTYLTVESI